MLMLLALLDTDDERNKFTRLYNKYRHFMWYIAKNILEDEYLAEDAVHEAFLTVAKHLKNVEEEDEGKTKSFLSAIVRCRSIDIIRKRNKTEIINIEDAQDYLPDGEELLEKYISEDNYQSLLKCILELDEKYRVVFELKYLHEMSDKAVADVLGISAKTVNVRMFRARKKLQEMLSKEAGYVG